MVSNLTIIGPPVIQQSIIDAWAKARVLAMIPSTVHEGTCAVCHIPMTRYGYTTAGVQRWKCRNCLVTSTGQRRAPNILKPAKIEAIKVALLTPGLTLRKIEVLTHSNKATIATYARLLGIQRPPCPCGQSAGHKGWCAWQFERSPIRRAALAKTWRPRIPSWQRPGIWMLGGDSMHSSDVHIVHCQWKACPFPAEEGTTRCRYHANFYEYPMTMHDTSIDPLDYFRPSEPHAPYSLINDVRPVDRVAPVSTFVRTA